MAANVLDGFTWVIDATMTGRLVPPTEAAASAFLQDGLSDP